MVRVKCSVSYDGSKFHGFQVQNKLRTVQGEIQKALKNICKEEIIIHGSGRTDAKVHGTKQVFHFDTTREMPEAQWKRAINHFLPNDIYILDSYFVDENFHSRYSAIKKEYHYLLSTKEYSPFETNYIFQYGRPLDLELMREAAKQVNIKLNAYREHYKSLEPEKLIAMVAYQFSQENLKLRQRNDTGPYTEKIEELTEMLEEYFKGE